MVVGSIPTRGTKRTYMTIKRINFKNPVVRTFSIILLVAAATFVYFYLLSVMNPPIFRYSGSSDWTFVDAGSTVRLISKNAAATQDPTQGCVDVVQYNPGSINASNSIAAAKKFVASNNPDAKFTEHGQINSVFHTTNGDVKYALSTYSADIKPSPYLALGYVPVEGGYIQIVTGCNNQANLEQAANALQSLTFAHNQQKLNNETTNSNFSFKDTNGWWRSSISGDEISAYSPDFVCAVDMQWSSDRTTIVAQLAKYFGGIEAANGTIEQRDQKTYSLKSPSGNVSLPVYFTEITKQPSSGSLVNKAIGVLPYKQGSVIVTYMCKNYDQLSSIEAGLAGFSLK